MIRNPANVSLSHTPLLQLALRSAWHRKTQLLLAILSIAISITLLLAVDTLRKETKHNFMQTVSGTDLIVGARSGPINLLLYSVFHIGNATNNIRYSSFEAIANNPKVKWAIPISLGDSHRGFRVIGTNHSFFQHYQFGDKQALQFKTGQSFDDLYDVVIGANVARQLGYQLDDRLILSHGVSAGHLPQHDDKPFRVVGILAPTGTPIDNSLQVSLEAIEAIHVDWKSGMRSPLKISAEITRKLALKPKTLTAMMVGLNNRLLTFKVQREINQFTGEPLLAILPGSTLADLWRALGLFEKVLLAIAGLVLFAGLIGMLITLLSTLNERRHEMAVLRAIGIHNRDILKLFLFESLLMMGAGILLGVALLYGLLYGLTPLLEQHYGVFIRIPWLDAQQLTFLAIAFGLAAILSVLPGWLAYRNSLADGLTVK